MLLALYMPKQHAYKQYRVFGLTLRVNPNTGFTLRVNPTTRGTYGTVSSVGLYKIFVYFKAFMQE